MIAHSKLILSKYHSKQVVFQVVNLLITVYIWPGPKEFCLFKSKSATHLEPCNSCTLCTVGVYASAKQNLILLIDGDAEPVMVGISISLFSISIRECCFTDGLQLLPLDQSVGRKT